jgi:hypothetical protein
MSARHARSRRRTVAVVVLACDVVAGAAIGVVVGTPHQRAAPVRVVRVVTTQCVDGSIVNAVDDGGPGLLAVDTGVSC